jgi:hypothetical protein
MATCWRIGGDKSLKDLKNDFHYQLKDALCIIGNCSIMPGNSAWIAERAGVRRYDFVDNAQHFQVIPTKVGIQMFFFSVRLPSVIEQLP